MTITAGELAANRADLASFLPASCVVQRPTAGTSDNTGDTTPSGTYTTVTTVVCAVAPSGAATEGEIGAGIDDRADWVITVPALTDVRTSDRITTGGRTLEVLGISGPRSFEQNLRAYCREA